MGVPPLEVSIVNESLLDSDCRACSCGTNKRFIIKAGFDSKSKMEKYGFKIIDG